MSTYFPKEGEIARKWFVVDAAGQTLGRLATRVATILAGKDSPRYTPFIDVGDHVIGVNADKVKLTGLKAESKMYRHYTGHPGGLREEDFPKGFQRKPESIVGQAVLGMLPKGKMGGALGRNLKVYPREHHPYEAQQPQPVSERP